MASDNALDGLRKAIEAAIGALDSHELQIFTLGVLHGIPVRQLPESPGRTADDFQATLIGALKKIRARLAQEGFDSESTLQVFRGWPR